jgi:hypothetical protein
MRFLSNLLLARSLSVITKAAAKGPILVVDVGAKYVSQSSIFKQMVLSGLDIKYLPLRPTISEQDR